MINFRKIYILGFGPIVNEVEFKLNRPGLNILIAKNGSGKTSIFSALYWALYGYTLKPTKTVNTWPHIQPEDYQGTRVRVRFDDDLGNKYEVIRFSEFKGKYLNAKGANRIVLLINGTPSPIRDKKEIQTEVNRLIGYSDELFKNSIIFGQRLKRLIQETGPNKKKVFEEAFEASYLNLAKKKADDDFKEAASEYSDISKSIENIKDKLTYAREEKGRYKEAIEQFDKDREVTVNQLKGYIDITLEKMATYSKHDKNIEVQHRTATHKLHRLLVESNIEGVERELFRAENRFDKLESEADTILNKIKGQKLNLVKRDKCPTCGTFLKDKAELIKHTQQEIKSLEEDYQLKIDEIGQARTEVKALKGKLSSQNNIKLDIDSLKIEIKKLDSILIRQNSAQIELKEFENQLNQYNQRLIKTKESKCTISTRDTTKRILAFKAEYLKLRASNKLLRIKVRNLEWVSKEALSNKGLKAYIFDTMLHHVNERLRYYEQFIGFKAEFRIAFDTANKDLYTVVYRGENMIFYEDLSGGQAQLVDVVSAFAVHDVVSAGRACNLMVMDEIFEGLDEDNADIVFELIQHKAHGKCLYLITHNLSLQNSSNKVIRMNLDSNGHTVMKSLGN